MIDWYYHDPGTGRVGPLSAEELRRRFQERQIQRDTLLWRHGLHEWQPLERLAVEIGLDRLEQDGARPPPMPATAGPAASRVATASTARTVARGKYSRTPLQQNKRKLSTGAIVAIAIVVIGIPGVMILGSIMLPAYRNYTREVLNAGAIEGLANGLKEIVGDYKASTGHCPDDDDEHLAPIQREIHQRFSLDVSFSTSERGCTFDIALNADGEPIDGKTLRYVGHHSGGEFAWDCSGGDMPEAYRPYECRNGG